MRKKFFSLLLIFILAISMTQTAYATSISDLQKQRQEKENQKKGTQSQLDSVNDQINDLSGEKDDVDAQISELTGQIAEIMASVSLLEDEIADTQVQIEQAQKDYDEAKAKEEAQYHAMKKRIQYLYEKGETSYLDLLFKSADLTQLFNRAEYISQIAAYDRKMLDQYEAASEEVAAREADLKAEHEELVTLKTNTEEKQKDAERLMNEKTAELKSYNSKIAASEGSLSDLEKDIAAQEDKIKAIEAELKRKEEEAKKAALEAGQKYNTVSIGNINFIWPCPASSRITSSFGDRESPTEGASSSHQGIDIGASTGSSILAAASGTVTISTYSYSAGNYIMINHGGGVSTVYMHCSELLVSAGQEVTQGQVIAKVGSTGYSTGPHLHFGIRVNGSYVNPINYVSP